MDLRIAHATDIGRNPRRDENEDAVLVDQLPLVAVADGMGGHEGGEVASNLAIDTLRTWKEKLTGRSGDDAAATLKEAFNDVNRTVFERGEADNALSGMGTTLTAGWINSEDDSVTFAHVGDSRLYLLRGKNLKQLTEDQTVAQELVRRGRIREDELESSPHRHYLLQAIGVETNLNIETSTLKLRPGDRLVFATDGVYGMLQESEQIRQILTEHPDAQGACEALVNAANEAGGHDNISVVIVDVDGGPAASVVEGEGDGDVVMVEPVSVAGAPSDGTKKPAGNRRWIVLGGALLLLAVMAVVFVLRPATSSLVVASRRGNVVILEGRPGRTETEPARGKVVHSFPDEKTDEFPTTVQRELRSGIVVDSLAEANQVVEQLPRVLGPVDTPSPEPSPTDQGASPDPSPSPTAKASP